MFLFTMIHKQYTSCNIVCCSKDHFQKKTNINSVSFILSYHFDFIKDYITGYEPNGIIIDLGKSYFIDDLV